MARAKLFVLTLFMAIPVFLPKTECQLEPFPTRPLCISQFALVDHVCSILPFHPPDDSDNDINDRKHELAHHMRHKHEHEHEHEHERKHAHEHEREHEHEHRHGHGHRHRHRDIEDNCCRWLKEVDSECVCELLVRLPPFLSRPAHEYTVNVHDECDVTFECKGRLRV